MVIEDVNATNKMIENATKELNNAISGLKLKTDKVALKYVIDYANYQVSIGALEDLVPIVKKEFTEALKEAIDVYENVNATASDIDLSYKRLFNAITMLEFKAGNKEELQALVTLVEALDEKEYTEETWGNLVVAIAKANEVIADENALQYEVDEAVEDLKEAVANLEKVEVNKDALNALVNLVKDKKEEEYIASTWEVFNKALSNANKVLENSKATVEEVDEAYNSLLRSYLKLRLNPDKSKLEELINKANSIDLSIYTEESSSRVRAAVAEAKKIVASNEAEKEDVEKAVKNLEVALSSLTEKNDGANTEISNGSNNNGNEDKDIASNTTSSNK